MAIHFTTRLSIFLLKLGVNSAIAVDIIFETFAGCKLDHLNKKDSARYREFVIGGLLDNHAVETSLARVSYVFEW